MEYTEASGWETRGFNFYRKLNNQILRGVPQAAAAMDKTVLLWAERWFDARIAGFRQQDCNRSILDEPITCNQHQLQSIRYRMLDGRLGRGKFHSVRCLLVCAKETLLNY